MPVGWYVPSPLRTSRLAQADAAYKEHVLMRKAVVLGITALVLVAPAPSQASESRSVRHAVTEFQSGLRRNDGPKACGRMTLRLRKHIIGVFVEADPSLAGRGCADILSLYGREIFMARQSINSLKVRGRCADFRGESRNKKYRAKKVDGRWRYDGPGSC